MKNFFIFVLALVISFLPGIFGVFFTPHGANDVWFNALNKSVLTPDGWVFSVAWSILYLLLGIALFLIIKNKTRKSKAIAYWAFVVQMALNALWSYLFFGLHFVGAALLCLIALIAVTIWMMAVFKPISKGAYYLSWPYLVWLCFALYLNGTVLFLN
ncbi:MAG: tryptophan-rich sensory protein [Alphaproteobacteria bacterium]|nr:tryptophan-rich sensory protein [Alphaproteobacteria bacterium]